jgi:hypothetical protein
VAALTPRAPFRLLPGVDIGLDIWKRRPTRPENEAFSYCSRTGGWIDLSGSFGPPLWCGSLGGHGNFGDHKLTELVFKAGNKCFS